MVTIKVDDEITLRVPELDDAARLFGLINRNREYLRKFLPWVDYSKTIKDSEDFIRESQQMIKEGKGLNFCLLYKNKIGGTIGLHYIDKVNKKTELGYWLAEDLQGQGVMTRSCRGLIDYVRNELGLHRIELRAAVDNTASCRMAERLGFTKEGILREIEMVNGKFVSLIVYSLLSTDKEER